MPGFDSGEIVSENVLNSFSSLFTSKKMLRDAMSQRGVMYCSSPIGYLRLIKNRNRAKYF